MGIILPLLLVLLASLIIWRASDAFETASDYLGRNLSDGVKGATINAIASSMPELFTSMFFLFVLKDVNGFSGGIGTTAGSAIFNSMIIPAIAILAVVYAGITSRIKVSQKVIWRDGLTLIVTEFLFILMISGNALYWYHGVFLMGIYVVYLIYMLTSMSKGEKISHEDYHGEPDEDEEEQKRPGIFRSTVTVDLESLVLGTKELKNSTAWPLLIVSTMVIALSCYFLVQACEWLGADTYHVPYLGELHGLDIPIMFVALILAAAASSIPDTIISMKDSKKGNYDDAISNALGSNMFDICFALGFPLFLFTMIHGPIYMTQEAIEMSGMLRMVLLILTVITFIVFISGKYMGKGKAFFLLGLYVVFTIFIIGYSNDHPVSVAIGKFMNEIVNVLVFWA
jgi:Ca2+/Na+ antiporter